jgi:hypothetical protein
MFVMRMQIFGEPIFIARWAPNSKAPAACIAADRRAFVFFGSRSHNPVFRPPAVYHAGSQNGITTATVEGFFLFLKVEIGETALLLVPPYFFEPF